MDEAFCTVEAVGWRPSSSESAYRELAVRAGEVHLLPDGDAGIVELYLTDVGQVHEIQQLEEAHIDLKLEVREDRPAQVLVGTPRLFKPPLPGEEMVRLELVGTVQKSVCKQTQ